MQNNTNLKNPHCSRNSIQKMTIDEPSALRDFKFMKPYENLSPEDMEGEIWKDIPGYEGLYEISNIPRIASVYRKSRSVKGRIILRHTINRYGYVIYYLYKNKKRKTLKAHRLIMLAFVGPSDLCIDHINMVRDDNRLENLEYVTYRENSTRAVKAKTKRDLPMGVASYRGKYSAALYVRGKRRAIGTFNTIEEASAQYQSAINDLENIDKYLKPRKVSPYGAGIRFQSGKFAAKTSKQYLGSFLTLEQAQEARRKALEDESQVSKAG